MQRYAPWAARAAVLLGLAGVVIIGSVRAAVPQPVPAARPQATGIFKPLYSFALQADGDSPGNLLAAGGKLYGTTYSGGAYGMGSVFELTTAGAERILYSFKGGVDGATPYAQLTYLNGALYGTTPLGGAYGNGIVFEITATGSERVLHSFKAGADGASPYGGLVFSNGSFFGTTAYGGPAGYGTVFQLSPSGVERVIYRFKGGADGGTPTAGLVAFAGALYGTTPYYGAHGHGTIFAVQASGSERVVYSFKGGADAANPDSPLVALGNALYGTSPSGGGSGCGGSGCGAVFEVNQAGTERIAYSFKGGAAGSAPYYGLLAANGVLYGGASDSSKGCGNFSCGILFALSPSVGERTLYGFAGMPDGEAPTGLAVAGGTLYGTTSGGGALGRGTVFALALSTRAERVLYSFAGGGSEASLANVGTELYGTTTSGGASNAGTVFEVSTLGAERELYAFKGGPDGAYPRGGLTVAAGAFYGTTTGGGAYGLGTLFTVDTAGVEHVLHSFKGGADGAIPEAAPILLNGSLYGTTAAGGSAGRGTVFEAAAAGAEHVLYSFKGGTDGVAPAAPLLAYGGALYGTTTKGGTAGAGTVFEVGLSGTERVLHSFTGGADGSDPMGGLVAANGSFFGTTTFGGSAYGGTVFEISPVGAERVVHAFGALSDGEQPAAGLVTRGGALYGTTRFGGNGSGAVFEVQPSGAEQVLLALGGGPGGAQPLGGISASGDVLYGATAYGGAHGDGIVYGVLPAPSPSPSPTIPPGAETVWIADSNGTLGTGGVTAYKAKPGWNELRAIPGDVIDDSRPGINSHPSGINAPDALAFDRNHNLWIASQLSDLVVAVSLGANGMTPQIVLPSGFTFPGGNPNALGFDGAGHLWVAGRQPDNLFPWDYQAYALAADLTPSAITTKVPGAEVKAQTQTPQSLVFDAKGELWTNATSPATASAPNGYRKYTLRGGVATASTFIAAPGCTGGTYDVPYTPYAFDSSGNLWCVNPGPKYDNPSIVEFAVPSGAKRASFAIPKPSGVDVSDLYDVVNVRFDPKGTLWVLVQGDKPVNEVGVPDYAALIAIGPTGKILTVAPLPNAVGDFFVDFVFQP